MAKEVGINIELFHQNVENLRCAVESLQGVPQPDKTLKKTNIKPFVDDMENVVKAFELLEKYQVLFEADLTTLKKVGDDMEEQDEQLASQNNSVCAAPQSI